MNEHTPKDSDHTTEAAPDRVAACAGCGKPVVHAFRPFCSKRCADLDLGRWLKGAYAIPAASDDDEDTLAADRYGYEGEAE